MNALRIATLVILAATAAHGHQLRAVVDTPLGPDNAIALEDVGVSQVVYFTASANAQQLWMTFEGTAGQVVHFETGVPFIDRLKDLRPTTMLVGPGLQEAAPPIEIPAGLGANVYPSAGITSPEVFNEPFTGTDSWEMGSWDITLPQTGRYYIVSFLPQGGPGKFWTAAGVEERFDLQDILSLPQTIIAVRTYHEIFPWGGFIGWGIVAIGGIIAALLRGLLG